MARHHRRCNCDNCRVGSMSFIRRAPALMYLGFFVALVVAINWIVSASTGRALATPRFKESESTRAVIEDAPVAQAEQLPGVPTWQDLRAADLRQGDFGEFDSTSVLNGRLFIIEPSERWPAVGDSPFLARASINGGGRNGYARAEWHVDWGQAATFRTDMNLYLPHDFYDSLDGSVQLLGWDTFPTLDNQMRLIISGENHRAHLFLKSDGDDSILTNSFWIPAGQWLNIAVEQKISDDDGWSHVYLDGELVASGSGDTATRYPVTRIRYGLVAIHAGVQKHDVSLNFGSVHLSTLP